MRNKIDLETFLPARYEDVSITRLIAIFTALGESRVSASICGLTCEDLPDLYRLSRKQLLAMSEAKKTELAIAWGADSVKPEAEFSLVATTVPHSVAAGDSKQGENSTGELEYTAQEIARMVNQHVNTVYDWAKQFGVRGRRGYHNQWFFSPAQYQEFALIRELRALRVDPIVIRERLEALRNQ